jgi:hypothetical protein
VSNDSILFCFVLNHLALVSDEAYVTTSPDSVVATASTSSICEGRDLSLSGSFGRTPPLRQNSKGTGHRKFCLFVGDVNDW